MKEAFEDPLTFKIISSNNGPIHADESRRTEHCFAMIVDVIDETLDKDPTMTFISHLRWSYHLVLAEADTGKELFEPMADYTCLL